MEKRGLIHMRKPFVGLPFECSEYALGALKNQPGVAKLWKKIRRHAFYWQFLPFVKSVFVCNSLAMGTAKKDSDIDVFVVTKKDRMFLARTIMTAWVHLTGTRRHGNKIKKRFCLSFWAAEDALDLSNLALRYDPYLYLWVATIKPVYDDETVGEFMEQNNKLLAHTPNRPVDYRKPLMKRTSSILSMRCAMEEIMEKSGLAKMMEEKLRISQKERAHKKFEELDKPYGIIIADNMLKFHDKDIRKEVADLNR
jgi:predicted nucleotidyltransferase